MNQCCTRYSAETPYSVLLPNKPWATMQLQGKPLNQIDRNDLDTLIENSIPEGRKLEYKRELVRPDQILAEATSFANAGGGVLILGIDKEERQATELRPIQVDNVDEQLQWFENLLRNGTDPRITGHRIKAVPVEDGFVFLIGVPRSWAAPHRVTSNRHFYTRNSAGRHAMDTAEIRAAFEQTGTALDRIKEFRSRRIGRIVAGETPIPLSEGPTYVLHIAPFEAFVRSAAIDITGVEPPELKPLRAASYDYRFNLDGFMTYPHVDETTPCYTQLFRNGVIEAVTANVAHMVEDNLFFSGAAINHITVQGLTRYLELLQNLDVSPPFAVMLSLLGFKGSILDEHRTRRGAPFQETRVERNHLIIPEIIVEEYGADLARALKPALDAVWNSGGHPRSTSYDIGGNWTRG